MMRRLAALLCSLTFLIMASCSSPQDRAARAEEDVARQRLELIEQHQDCVDEADGDQQKISACEVYLKEADALK